ncbi:hypothetical protein [Echinicola marina]|nr:hypothetical protein [Echinicola marina]
MDKTKRQETDFPIPAYIGYGGLSSKFNQRIFQCLLKTLGIAAI